MKLSRSFASLILICLEKLIIAEILPDYQSLTWKYNGTNCFAPLALNTSVYATASPPGTLPSSLNKRASCFSKETFVPCTVITLNGSVPLTATVASDIVGDYEALDDVWTPSQFLECLFVQNAGNGTAVQVQQSFMDFLVTNDVKHSFFSGTFNHNASEVPSTAQVTTLSQASNLANGPYVASISSCGGESVSMTPVYTLHTDDYEAFMEGSIPNAAEPNSHIALHFSIPGTRLPSIIIPSRIPFPPTPSTPLSGLRFAVKDIFHIRGLKTSGGSRSYYSAYSPQNYTTETVQICLDGGAQLIGKTRTIAFALTAPNDGQEVDFLNPWNARGDGYQNTGGSSSGSGAAVTGYGWVDFALGSDTGGSVRFPSRYGGLYGYKPSHGIFNITGILVAIAEQDTPGFMTRSPEIFTTLGKYWAKNKPLAPLPSQFPKNLLLYADEPILEQPAAEKLKQEFFTNISVALNLTTTSINITSTFLSTNTSSTSPPQDLTTYLYYVYSDQNNVQGWDEIGKPLFSLYQELFDGASPPTGDPPVNISWTDGQNATTRARYPESQRRRERFAEFWNGEVVKGDESTCSESIFAHSYHTPPTLEKVVPLNASLVAPGWWNGVAINYAGIPEIVVPIGQVEYFSPFTLKTELQPVTVALAAAKGCDLVLFDMVDKLVEAGLLKEVMPGKTAFPV